MRRLWKRFRIYQTYLDTFLVGNPKLPTVGVIFVSLSHDVFFLVLACRGATFGWGKRFQVSFKPGVETVVVFVFERRAFA